MWTDVISKAACGGVQLLGPINIIDTHHPPRHDALPFPPLDANRYTNGPIKKNRTSMVDITTSSKTMYSIEDHSCQNGGGGGGVVGLSPLMFTAPPSYLPCATTLSCGGGLNRSKSQYTLDSSMSESSYSSIESFSPLVEEDHSPSRCGGVTLFVSDLRHGTGPSPDCPDFFRLRPAMEPHLRCARLLRESSRLPCSNSSSNRRIVLHPKQEQQRRQSSDSQFPRVEPSIASSMGVPYTALRKECPFLFDPDSHPLHTILADTLNVQDLSRVHLFHECSVSEQELLLPLLDKHRRHRFHAAYDAFVTTFCIPLLHSMALTKRVLQQQHSDDRTIAYRYQAFPTIQISRPGGHVLPSPTCDSIQGHSVACLTFFIPLTPCEGTNCMFVESHPGKEDWHPLGAKSVGLGYVFDGSRCLHFDLENTTQNTRVSLKFRVMIYRDGDDAADLCPVSLLHDVYATAPYYYDEAVIDLQQRTETVTKRRGGRSRLLDPGPLNGYPFA